MRIRWTPLAAAHLQSISEYLKRALSAIPSANPAQIVWQDQRLEVSTSSRCPGRIEGTRELLFSPLPYIAVYSVRNQNIEIWRIYHAAQNRP